MNFDYDFSSASNTLMDARLMNHHLHLNHSSQFNHNLLRTVSSHGDDLNASNHTFDCLINEVESVNVDCIANENKSDEENDARFDLLNHQTNSLLQQQQQQMQNDGIKKQQINRANSSLCSNIEKNLRFLSSENSSKFNYILMAPTSPAVKANEDTLTYLNQGQNYELRINRINNQFNSNYLNDQRQMEDIKPIIIESKLNKDSTTLNQIVCSASDSESAEKLSFHNLNDSNSSLYLSIVRVCFWDRKLQEIEQEEIKEVFT